MENLDLDKLICAIELLLYKSLKENSDDSYSHHLIDFVRHVKKEMTLDDLNRLASIVGTALNHETAVNDIDLSTAFKLTGTIVSDERMISTNPDGVITSFKSIIRFDHLLKDEEHPHYDLQYSFLNCIKQLCSTQSGGLFLASKDELLLIIFHLLTRSKGFYIQTEAQSVINSLLTKTLTNRDEAKKLDPYLHQMLLINCKTHLECLRKLVEDPEIKRFLINQFNLESILVSKLESTIRQDEELLLIFCRILSSCDLSQESIDKVSEKLLKAKKLKSLIAFYTQFICYDHVKIDHLDQWKLFTIYPLIRSDEQLSNQITGNETTKKLIDECITNDTIMFALHNLSRWACSMISINKNQLYKIENRFIVDCLGKFIQQSIDSMAPRKLIVEGLEKFKLIGSNTLEDEDHNRYVDILLQLIRRTFNQQSIIDSTNSRPLPFWIFNMIRDSLNYGLFPVEIIPKICSLIKDIMVSTTSENDFDLVDSSLEVVIGLLPFHVREFVSGSTDFIEIFLDQWTKHYQSSNNHSLISSCIPILIAVDLFASSEVLAKHSMIKHQTIPSLMVAYINEGEYLLRDAVIKAFQMLLPTFIGSHATNIENHFEMFIRYFGLPMSQLILSEIDFELLKKILETWGLLLTIIASTDNRKFISMLYRSGFFTSLWLLPKDQLVHEKIKSGACEIVGQVSKLFNQMGLTESDLIGIFRELEEPEFFIPVTDDNDGPNERIKNREQVVDEIFKENSTLPTQDLINVVTDQLTTGKKLIKRRRDLGNVPIESIVSYFIEAPVIPIIPSKLSEPEFNWSILDDIIAARSFDTRIPSDCY